VNTHLFVAPSSASFGEVVLGIRLAHELHARGDRIIFLAPSANQVLLEGAPFQVGRINRMTSMLDVALPSVIRDVGATTVVLVDLLVMLVNASLRSIAPTYLDTLPATVVALDIWDMRRNVLRLDTHADEIEVTFPESAHHVVPRRLVPVPFVRPDARGAYCALPAPTSLTDEDRARTRVKLNLEDRHRLVVLTTSNFQSRMLGPRQQREHAPVLARIANLCQQAGDDVRVLHVGPQPVDGAGSRYRHHAQLAPAVFRRLIQAADLVITPNQSATTITTALDLRVPALAVISSSRAREVPPGFPFRVFPLGFCEFMGRLVADNPYCDAVPAVELIPGDAVVDTARSLLFDDVARAAALARIATYLEEVRRLPSGADRFYSLL
jgi:Family of unknown function (DUF6365)